jgi:hypothetical protein
MKVYWGVEVELHAFLTSARIEVSGQFHAPGALPPGKETHCIGSCTGHQRRFGRGGEENISQLLSEMGSPIILLVAQRYTTELPGSSSKSR